MHLRTKGHMHLCASAHMHMYVSWRPHSHRLHLLRMRAASLCLCCPLPWSSVAGSGLDYLASLLHGSVRLGRSCCRAGGLLPSQQSSGQASCLRSRVPGAATYTISLGQGACINSLGFRLRGEVGVGPPEVAAWSIVGACPRPEGPDRDLQSGSVSQPTTVPTPRYGGQGPCQL